LSSRRREFDSLRESQSFNQRLRWSRFQRLRDLDFQVTSALLKNRQAEDKDTRRMRAAPYVRDA
jgi:hypothetical protein